MNGSAIQIESLIIMTTQYIVVNTPHVRISTKVHNIQHNVSFVNKSLKSKVNNSHVNHV